MLAGNNFGRKNIFGRKFFLAYKFFLWKKNFGRQKFLVRKFFGLEKILVRKKFVEGGGQVTPIILHIPSSWVKIRLHAENHLPRIFILVGLKWCYIPKISFLGWGDPNFFLHISSGWVKIRLHTENPLTRIFLYIPKISFLDWGRGRVRWPQFFFTYFF